MTSETQVRPDLSVQPPKKPPTKRRGVAQVLLGAAAAVALTVASWIVLGIAESALGVDSEKVTELPLALGAAQFVVATLFTIRLWGDGRKAAAISLGVITPPALFVSWVLWLLTHMSWC